MPILIPNGAFCFRRMHLHEPMSYHVEILDETLFEAFCKENNIGNEQSSRGDVKKNSRDVSTKDSWIFEKFPQNTIIYGIDGNPI